MKNMTKIQKLANATIIALPLLITNNSVLAGDPGAGKEKAAVCVACHGEDGNSPIPTNPRLAGQYEDYLAYSLATYRSGERQNAIMNGIASGLSDEDIADLSAWFASQSGLNILDRDPM